MKAVVFDRLGPPEELRLAELLDLHRQGRLQVSVRRVLPMAEIIEAHRLVETGHGIGKVVIQVAD